MKPNRIIIAGSRTVPEDSTILKDKINKILFHIDCYGTEIVSGTCKGADILGENYAKDNDLPLKQFPADWDNHGKRAGYLRNKQMAEYATHLVAIVDLAFESRGTRHMIDLAEENGLEIRILYINEDKAKFPKISLGTKK